MAYSEKVLNHYTNPQNVGTLDKNKASVGSGLDEIPGNHRSEIKIQTILLF